MSDIRMDDGTSFRFFRSTTAGFCIDCRGKRGSPLYIQWVTPEAAQQIADQINREMTTSDQMIESVMAIAKDRHDRQGDFTVKAILMNPAITEKTTESGRVSGRLGSHARICLGPPSVSVCYTVSWEQIARAYFFEEPVEINN